PTCCTSAIRPRGKAEQLTNTIPTHAEESSPCHPRPSSTPTVSTSTSAVPGPRQARPHRPYRSGRRFPRSERLRKVHDHPCAARPAQGRLGLPPPPRWRSLDGSRVLAPPPGLCTRRRVLVAQPDRWTGHRPARSATRRARHTSEEGVHGTLRTRPHQEGPHLLQGQPAKSRP